MQAILKRIKDLDIILVLSIFVVSGIGLASLFSVNSDLALRQLFFIILGFILMIGVSFVDWRIFKEKSFVVLGIYLLSTLSLYGLLLFGPTIRGVQRWYRIGDFLIDPAELFKIALLILLAKFFSTRHVEMYKISHIVLSGIYVLVPVFLIFRQPDLGSALILVIMWIVILLISGIKLKHFIVISMIGLVLLSSGWLFFLKDYQKDRAIAFINPELDPQGIGWGQSQAQIAVGNGGLFGQGFGQGTQTQYGFLPEPETDFIFAAIAEEFGLLGVFILFSGFILFIWRIIIVIINSKTNFPRLFATGFSIIIITQVAINAGMNLGILPIIGTPMPLVSYGGSSLLFVFIGLGLIHSIRRDII